MKIQFTRSATDGRNAGMSRLTDKQAIAAIPSVDRIRKTGEVPDHDEARLRCLFAAAPRVPPPAR